MGWGFQWINIPAPPRLIYSFFEHAQKRVQSAKKKERGRASGLSPVRISNWKKGTETNRKSIGRHLLFFFLVLCPSPRGLCPARVWLNGCTQDRNAVTARPPPPCVLKRREGSPLFIFWGKKPLERLTPPPPGINFSRRKIPRNLMDFMV